jgi:hypothetical protein
VPERVSIFTESRFIETESPSPITEFGIALASKRDNYYWACGTAVIVAPHLAITATHNVQDHWEKNQGKWPEAGDVTGGFSLFAFQVPEGGEACLWTVPRLWNSPHTDITFLKLIPGSVSAASYRWRQPKLNALPPDVGSRIAAFGYHSSKIEPGTPVQWHHKLSNSFGTVKDVYVERRDSVLRKYPCFSTDARFDGGMSGGPVFNEAGELCGLICSGIDAFDAQDQHTCYVSTLWPSLATFIDLDRVGHPTGVQYPAIELARDGQMVVRNWQRVGLERDDTGISRVWLTRETPRHAV